MTMDMSLKMHTRVELYKEMAVVVKLLVMHDLLGTCQTSLQYTNFSIFFYLLIRFMKW